MKKLYYFTIALPSLVVCMINHARVILKAKWICALGALAMVVLVGCTSVSYKTPDGTEISYTRLFTNVGSIEAKTGNTQVKVSDTTVDPAVAKFVADFMAALKTALP